VLPVAAFEGNKVDSSFPRGIGFIVGPIPTC
jgi:hypothetical protein